MISHSRRVGNGDYVCGGGKPLLNIPRKRATKRAREDIKENVGGGLLFRHEHLRRFWDPRLWIQVPKRHLRRQGQSLQLVGAFGRLAGAAFLALREKGLTKRRNKRPFLEGFLPETCVGL